MPPTPPPKKRKYNQEHDEGICKKQRKYVYTDFNIFGYLTASNIFTIQMQPDQIMSDCIGKFNYRHLHTLLGSIDELFIDASLEFCEVDQIYNVAHSFQRIGYKEGRPKPVWLSICNKLLNNAMVNVNRHELKSLFEVNNIWLYINVNGYRNLGYIYICHREVDSYDMGFVFNSQYKDIMRGLSYNDIGYIRHFIINYILHNRSVYLHDLYNFVRI